MSQIAPDPKLKEAYQTLETTLDSVVRSVNERIRDIENQQGRWISSLSLYIYIYIYIYISLSLSLSLTYLHTTLSTSKAILFIQNSLRLPTSSSSPSNFSSAPSSSSSSSSSSSPFASLSLLGFGARGKKPSSSSRLPAVVGVQLNFIPFRFGKRTKIRQGGNNCILTTTNSSSYPFSRTRTIFNLVQPHRRFIREGSLWLKDEDILKASSSSLSLSSSSSSSTSSPTSLYSSSLEEEAFGTRKGSTFNKWVKRLYSRELGPETPYAFLFSDVLVFTQQCPVRRSSPSSSSSTGSSSSSSSSSSSPPPPLVTEYEYEYVGAIPLSELGTVSEFEIEGEGAGGRKVTGEEGKKDSSLSSFVLITNEGSWVLQTLNEEEKVAWKEALKAQFASLNTRSAERNLYMKKSGSFITPLPSSSSASTSSSSVSPRTLRATSRVRDRADSIEASSATPGTGGRRNTFADSSSSSSSFEKDTRSLSLAILEKSQLQLNMPGTSVSSTFILKSTWREIARQQRLVIDVLRHDLGFLRNDFERLVRQRLAAFASLIEPTVTPTTTCSSVLLTPSPASRSRSTSTATSSSSSDSALGTMIEQAFRRTLFRNEQVEMMRENLSFWASLAETALASFPPAPRTAAVLSRIRSKNLLRTRSIASTLKLQTGSRAGVGVSSVTTAPPSGFDTSLLLLFSQHPFVNLRTFLVLFEVVVLSVLLLLSPVTGVPLVILLSAFGLLTLIAFATSSSSSSFTNDLLLIPFSRSAPSLSMFSSFFPSQRRLISSASATNIRSQSPIVDLSSSTITDPEEIRQLMKFSQTLHTQWVDLSVLLSRLSSLKKPRIGRGGEEEAVNEMLEEMGARVVKLLEDLSKIETELTTPPRTGTK
jgi:hypothetical protein